MNRHFRPFSFLGNLGLTAILAVGILPPLFANQPVLLSVGHTDPVAARFVIPIKLKKGTNVLALLISQAGRNMRFNSNLDTYNFRLELPDWIGIQ